jgi:hypothetical protein
VRLELQLQRDLPVYGIQIGLGRALENRAGIAGRLPDCFERPQPMQMRQPVAVLLIALVVMPADVMVLSRITDDGLGNVRPSHLGQPTAQTAFFQRQMFRRRWNVLEVFDQLRLGGGEAPVPPAIALLI